MRWGEGKTATRILHLGGKPKTALQMPARAWAAEMRLARLLQLRAQRRWLNMRIYRKAAELTQIRNRCNTIKPHDILLFATVKDEYIRLPYFLDYYRKIGIGHFLIV
ncbi:MAG: hypothetical protein ACPGMX_12840, partial [Paracoccaceae bacterium]